MPAEVKGDDAKVKATSNGEHANSDGDMASSNRPKQQKGLSFKVGSVKVDVDAEVHPPTLPHRF